jgi:SNF2 family DNA or RNA helicase
MEIIENKALKLRVRDPDRITTVIPRSKRIATYEDGTSEVLVYWGYEEVQVLKNLRVKNVPSPILREYKWTGIHQPFEHQKVTSAFLTLHRRAYLLSEMGTGKTASAIWAADYLLSKGLVKRVLVVCPLSIMESAWRADLFKFAMHRSVDIAHGSREKRNKVIESGADFVVINYAGIEIVSAAIDKGGFDLFIIDEYNHYKNAQSTRWKVMNALIKPNTWVWGMTGSPASQCPTEAYGLAKLMNPDSVPKFFSAFRDAVMTKLTTFKYIPKLGAEEYVHKVLQPAIRYTKDECLDLPDMLYVTREVPLTPQQNKYYKQLKERMLIEAAGEEITTVNAAVNLNKLLQLASGSIYTDTKEVLEFDASNRLNALEEVIEETEHKVLVFANFRHGIELIEKHLVKKGFSVGIIHGGIGANKRTELFAQFQTEPNPRILVIQPQAAAHGVTLTAANTIVWWGPVTSYETFVQANARVHRAGQKNKCTVVQLTGSPVEDKLYAALGQKEKMQNSIMALYKEELKS